MSASLFIRNFSASIIAAVYTSYTEPVWKQWHQLIDILTELGRTINDTSQHFIMIISSRDIVT